MCRRAYCAFISFRVAVLGDQTVYIFGAGLDAYFTGRVRALPCCRLPLPLFSCRNITFEPILSSQYFRDMVHAVK
jgi:hypothetical protein